MKPFLPVALAATLLAVGATPVASAQSATITDVDLKRDTAMLASDAFEGRRPGTPGGDKAVAYIVARMKAIGLTPGNHGQWTQDVPLVTITTTATPLMIGGGKASLTLAYGTDVVLWTKRQVARQVLAASPLVFVGYGIVAPEKGWNDYAGVDVHGKTVVFLVNDPDWQTTAAGKDAGLFEGRAETYYGRYTYKFEEAMRQGAAAALVIHDTEPAGYPWGVVTTSWTGPQIDVDSADRGVGRTGVEGWITRAAAERMLAAGGQDLSALTAAAQVKGFRPVPLPLTAATTLINTITRSASQNVVGVLPGSSFAQETVLVTAHWDHLGRCPADAAGDDICNGAVDNASGVAGLLTLAKAFATGPKLPRTLTFIAVTGEESGLLGSRWYAEHPVEPLALAAGGVNMDGLNVGGRTHDFVISGGAKSQLDAMADGFVRAQHRTFAPEPSPEKGGYFRSDHFSFAKFGVPMFRGGSGIDRVVGGAAAGQAAADDYVANRYHKPGDNYDPSWDWSGAVDDLTVYQALLTRLAVTRDWPAWNDGETFKAIRDASAAARR